MLNFDDKDLNNLKNGNYKNDPYLNTIDESDIIAELATNLLESNGSKDKAPTIDSPFIETDDVARLLDKIELLIPKKNKYEFENIADQILTNLENQSDYFMSEWKNS